MDRIYIYRCEGAWFAAGWTGDAYDCTWALDAGAEREAIAEVAREFPHAAVRRVADVSRDGHVMAR